MLLATLLRGMKNSPTTAILVASGIAPLLVVTSAATDHEF